MLFWARGKHHPDSNTLPAQPLAPHPSLRAPKWQRAPSTNCHCNTTKIVQEDRAFGVSYQGFCHHHPYACSALLGTHRCWCSHNLCSSWPNPCSFSQRRSSNEDSASAREPCYLPLREDVVILLFLFFCAPLDVGRVGLWTPLDVGWAGLQIN